MKRRKKKTKDLASLFQSTCGWCGKYIPPDTEVFGGGGKARPDIDLSNLAGQVIPVHILTVEKTVLIAVVSKDSDARRAGYDFMYMACSEDCATRLSKAFQADMNLRDRLDQA
jgi:hypothetical protein